MKWTIINKSKATFLVIISLMVLMTFLAYLKVSSVVFASLSIAGLLVTIFLGMKMVKETKHTAADLEASEKSSMELALVLSEDFEILQRLAKGDNTARASEKSESELLVKLGKAINDTAEGVQSMVDQTHELAMGLCESFEVLTRLSKGDLTAEAPENSENELLARLGKVINNEIKTAMLTMQKDSLDLALTLSEDFEVLQKMAQGDFTARTTEKSDNELLAKLGQAINHTAESVQIMVDQDHEVAIGLCENFEILRRLSEGDLTVRATEISSVELIGKLGKTVNKLIVNLGGLIGQITECANSIASASAQISSSTEEIARGAENQTTQAVEAASAAEEVSATIIETANNSSEASSLAKNAAASANKGRGAVGETTRGMEGIAGVVNESASAIRELGTSSNRIGEIIAVIDDIAGQTNLLALNAAIEAARAGEQGRGFAVVADEVRRLAVRTTSATKEITSMIKGIQDETGKAVFSMEKCTKEVEEGKILSNKAGEALKEILDSNQKLLEMIQQIAAAAAQQSSAAEEVSKNVEQISVITRQTAVGTQQSAEAAVDLNSQAEKLTHVVSQFKLET